MLKRFIYWIKKKFAPKPPPPTPIKEHGTPGYFEPVWGMINPHLKNKPGATSYDGKYSEYMYGAIMIPVIGVCWDTRDHGGVYGAVKRLVENYKINASLEPHYNAFNRKARGFEILALKGDKLSIKFALMCIELFESKYPNRKKRHGDGVKLISYGDRGYNNLVAAKRAGVKVALLSELFFGDNPNDWLDPKEQAAFWREALDINHID